MCCNVLLWVSTWNSRARHNYTWAQNSSNNLYIQESLTTLDVGKPFQKQKKVVITNINSSGDVLQAKTYGYGSLSSEQQTVNCTYTNFGLALHCNTVEGGQTVVNFYHGFDSFNIGSLPGGSRLWESPGHDPHYLKSVNNGLTTTQIYRNVAGQETGTHGPHGSTSTTYTGSAGSIVPQTITAANLSTTMDWNGFLGLTTATPSNGNGVSFGYDSFARKTTETSKDGAQTTYTYGPNNSWIQATTNGRFVKTYFDGIGRTVKVEAGHGSTVLSIVETEYGPCGCSPVGKVHKTSLPYAPGGTKYWTEYTYDGLGRTLSVKQPNNSGTTSYVYEANTVQVTSPSGKWKKYEMDGLGRLIKVIEPRPAGGTYETTYLYNAAGKLKQVIMPRDGVTQNRYFNYDTTTGTRLLSTQNPENGTVTYTYNTDGTVASKVDANDIRTEYTYDQYKRPTQMRKVNNSTSEERRCERVDYFYDEGGGANTGRLTRMRWNWDASANPCTVPGTSKKAAFEETYAYTAAGRVAGKNIDYRYDYVGNVNLDASWTYDNEGRLTSQTYPARSGQTGTRRVMTYSYDSMGRLEGVAQNWDNNPLTSTNIATSAQYNFQGALTSLNILGQTETRQYNTLGQLTRIQGAGINIEYQFSTTANDGKIAGQKNWATGEEVTYQYDALERLISAATVSSAWGLSWSYDGFGNRLNQNVTKGTAPSMSTLVDANTNRLSGFGYSYDNNGNLLTMPQQSTSMAYDASNRMVTFTNQNDTESYQYAPDNKRVWRSNACQDGQGAKHPSFYYYSAFGQLLGEYCTISGSVTVKQENFHFGGRIVAKGDTPGAITSLTTDRLHSKGDGSTFFPYGETKSGNPITGDSFATYSRDWTGLDYADQRWYAPGVGRFTSSDPYERSAKVEDSGSWNRYLYVGNDPINFGDPSGLARCLITTYTFDEVGGALAEFWCSSAGRTIRERVWRSIDIGDLYSDQGLRRAEQTIESDFGQLLDGEEMAFLLNKTSLALTLMQGKAFSVDCDNWLKRALGVGIADVKEAAAKTTIHNGYASNHLYSSLLGGGAASAAQERINPGYTIAQFFEDGDAIRGGVRQVVHAVARLNSNDIYMSPAFVELASIVDLQATLFHEILHNITGEVDQNIASAFGLPSGALSFGINAITTEIKRRCF